MATAATQVDQAVSVVRGLQANMNSYSSQMMGGWQGQAATAFTNTYEAFSADFSKVLTALQGIQEQLVGTHSTYTTTEESNVTSVSRIAGALG